MKVLALESFYGGSHRAFLDGWSNRSHHDWTILHLPSSHWKWRMRHAAVTFADEIAERLTQGERWDILFCSDMLDLATFLGLSARKVQDLPSVAYFHENQLTYPIRVEEERDYHFAMTNLTTCLAATEVWFNSDFHRRSFLEELPRFLQRMPDQNLQTSVKLLETKTSVIPQGIEDLSCRDTRADGPMRILWAARWEHDKNPEDFFEAMKLLKTTGTDFRLDVLGEQYEDCPEVFAWAKDYFSDEIDHWGFQPSRQEYLATLRDADVVVSTANHEFFGISIVEAIASGAIPLLPRRLAYPEVLNVESRPEMNEFFYDGTPNQLAERLGQLASSVADSLYLKTIQPQLLAAIEPYRWNSLSSLADQALEEVARTMQPI